MPFVWQYLNTYTRPPKQEQNSDGWHWWYWGRNKHGGDAKPERNILYHQCQLYWFCTFANQAGIVCKIFNNCLFILKKNVYENHNIFFLFKGDTCCTAFSLGIFKFFLEKQIPGVYVHSLRIGNSTIEDLENSYFMYSNKQVNYACKKIANDPKLKGGFNAIGFSQGSQFL